MKLYNLYEEIILEGLITEGVNTQQIIDTIDGEYANNGKKFIRRIRINYDGDDVTDKFGNTTREGKGWRNIVVHALGRLKNGGREVIRAYQVYGDSLRQPNNPDGWKLFRVDRISHWEPTNLKYWEPIEIAGQPTNMTGDNSMVGEVKVVNFNSRAVDNKNDSINQDNEYIDTQADTYRYDNAETEPVEPDKEVVPTFDDEEDNTGIGLDDEKIKNALNDEPEYEEESDYEEEDIEDENDEIKDY